MKRKVTSILLTLVLTLCLVGNAFAAESTAESGSVTITGVDGSTVEIIGTKDDQVKVTFTSTALKNGEQYIILMVSGETSDAKPVPDITESSIRYIDQQQVPATGNSVTFTVYPDKLETSVILISSASTGEKIAAIVSAKFVLGDVDGDGEITAADASAVLRHVAGIDKLVGDKLLSANVDSDADITAADAAKLLRVVAKIEQL